jgi:hypothetical protein
MPRAAAPGDFQVQVDGLGSFTFARRTMRDEFAIHAEYSRVTEGVDSPTNFLASFAEYFSVLKVLTVAAPDGWNVETIDPQEDASLAQLKSVFAALRAKEADFRRKPGAAV